MSDDKEKYDYANGQFFCKLCNCFGMNHDRECPNWDALREFNLIEAQVNALQTLIDDGFEVTLGRNNQCYFIGLKHPTQNEEFTGDTLNEALTEFKGWFNECQAMM